MCLVVSVSKSGEPTTALALSAFWQGLRCIRCGPACHRVISARRKAWFQLRRNTLRIQSIIEYKMDKTKSVARFGQGPLTQLITSSANILPVIQFRFPIQCEKTSFVLPVRFPA